MRHTRKIFIAAALLAVALSAGLLLAVDSSKAKTPPNATTPAPLAKTQYWFGVAVENLTPAFSKQLKLNPDQGLMVFSVLPDSPATLSGLQNEDILVEINDHPLTSQNDLYLAANPATLVPGAAPAPSKLTYLRNGDRTTIEITPAARPPGMISYPEENNKQKVLTYVNPNGGGAQVGPGFKVNLAADPSSFTARSIKEIVSQGKTIILSQETDIQGNIKNTITVGTTTHVVDPHNIDALPAELRPLAKQLVSGSPAQVHTPAPMAVPQVPATTTSSLEQRLNALESKNKELESQNAEFQKRIKELEKDRSK